MQTNNTELKVRAKRLRAAITAVLGVEVTNSQSLELVAQEENYPTWDAACACHKTTKAQGNDLHIKFVNADKVKLENTHILIGGRMGTGKTTLAHGIANLIAEKLSTSGADPLPVIVFSSIMEYPVETFISTQGNNLEDRLALVDLEKSVLLIDECIGKDRRGDDFWLDLARKAKGAVVTNHCGDKVDPRLLKTFQFISCNSAAKYSH